VKRKKLIEVKNLRTYFNTEEGLCKAVDGVSFDIYQSETLGIVGESGCGKSVTALSIMRLISNVNGTISGGKVLFNGIDLIQQSQSQMRKIRGNDISMIFQEPMTSLNPVFTIGEQISEAILIHENISKKSAMKETTEMLRKVNIPLPEKRVNEYPFQLSGGMRQRVMIAMALSCNPKLLIADEPTTALDVTIQAQILDIMNNLKKKYDMSIMMITHNLGVIAEISDQVAVMYTGNIVEYSNVKSIFRNPKHPYTIGLMKCIPRIKSDTKRLHAIPGNVPNPINSPKGCSYHTRCPIAMDICSKKDPSIIEVEKNHFVRCWNFDELKNIKKF